MSGIWLNVDHTVKSTGLSRSALVGGSLVLVVGKHLSDFFDIAIVQSALPELIINTWMKRNAL